MTGAQAVHFVATLALRSISLPTRMDSPSKSFWPTFQTLFRCQAGDHYFGWFHAVIQVVFILLAAQDDVEVLSQTEVLLCIEQAVKVDMLKGVMDAFPLTEVRQQTKYANTIPIPIFFEKNKSQRQTTSKNKNNHNETNGKQTKIKKYQNDKPVLFNR